MADDFIQVPPDSTGKKVDNSKLTVGGNDVYRQRGNLSSPTDPDAHAEVKNVFPAVAEYGMVTREAPVNLTEAPISINSATTTEIVAAEAAKLIEIWKIWLWANGDQTFDLKDGAISFSGPMKIAEGGDFVRGMDRAPWFRGTVNTAINIVTTQTGQMVGRVYYRKV